MLRYDVHAIESPIRMNSTVLYLSRADIVALQLDPSRLREAVNTAFKAHHADRSIAKPKLAFEIGPGHAFQSLCAASSEIGLASTKWLGMAPLPGAGGANIDALIALNDFATGKLLAIMDGNVLTAVRTAAMSAAAAAALARPDSTTIGFVGCGVQAHAHLPAMKALLPGLGTVLAFGKGRASTERFAEHARDRGFAVETLAAAEAVIRGSDVVITSVPTQAGFTPFLSPEWLAPGSFVSGVDIARNWLPETLRKLDLLVTDDHRQQANSPALSDTIGPLGSFDADLSEIAGGEKPGRTHAAQRAMFIFRGFAVADLAVAACVFEAAVAQGRGMQLPR
jgi:ornithine cyclodeaminase/alanine dehydrogenase-like protein (mu-crystallin family)